MKGMISCTALDHLAHLPYRNALGADVLPSAENNLINSQSLGIVILCTSKAAIWDLGGVPK